MKLAVIFCFLLICACEESESTDSETNQGGNQGGTNQGGAEGGTSQGGTSQGGTSQGGAEGGTNQGGAEGGTSQGGTNEGGTEGGASQGGAEGGTGQGGDMNEMNHSSERDQCTENTDCREGVCQAIPNVPNAVRYCISPPNYSMYLCEGNPHAEGCCSDRDCSTANSNGYCVAFEHGYCGGAAPPMINECRFNECVVDDDCQTGLICAPAGFGGRVVNHCMTASCQTDADCTAGTDGECRPLQRNPSCHHPKVFVCTYHEDECRSDSDCSNNQLCIASDVGVLGCQEYQPLP